MKKELQDKIFNDFPQLYRDRVLPDTISRMCDGFYCCGDGWYDIIYNLSKEIHEFCLKHKLEGDSYIRVFQVKSKWASLRYYLEESGKLTKDQYDEVYALISKAANMSSKTCEVCGKPGKLYEANYWASTLCEEHRNR
jgi:hypothetical protein